MLVILPVNVAASVLSREPLECNCCAHFRIVFGVSLALQSSARCVYLLTFVLKLSLKAYLSEIDFVL